MKVLFAVNSESISDAIIKKYQKEYKEILTYKNVYYFNAIIKELQKDKTYDRIVISEDLEPFANNNYDVIDKFLFEKLDRISDEATDLNGNDIPTILICTDRRSKSDSLLIKLFGIGIYSAIIGKDRSIDEVCRLISIPRTKKEAKQYYNIDSDDVNYQVESESDVREEEIQSILMHYKRLGRNTEKYVDSFNNIASQYTDAQLKIIAKFLPLNVKAVLETDSPKYQELITENGVKGSDNNKAKSEKKKDNLNPKDIEFDAFNNKTENSVLSKPVVIPSALKTKKTAKTNNSNNKKVENNIENESKIKLDKYENEYNDETEENVEVQAPKKGRGRPKKNALDNIEQDNIEQDNIEQDNIEQDNIEEETPKKGRGRPKKVLEDDTQSEKVKFKSSKIAKIRQMITDEEDELEDILDIPEIDDEELNEDVDLFGIAEDENINQEEEREAVETEPNYNVEENAQPQIKKNEPSQNYLPDNTLITGEGKIVSFVGTSKNGTSFIVNNLAISLSEIGVKTAILDTTENKNSYYIFTKNDEHLRMQANNSIMNLSQGKVGGIQVNKYLNVYTCVPNEKIEVQWGKVLDTLSKEYSVVLVDCDFNTNSNIFKNSKEIYLVQSMDILTIQPVTSFLRDLKNKNILDNEKIRIIINKYEKIKNITPNVLIGGMAFYNDPGMSFMTELFNKDKVKYTTLPLDTEVYLRYLECLVTCELSRKGYTKNFLTAFNDLKNMVYPLVSSNNKKSIGNKKYKEFSSNMDQTLSKMKKNY